MPGENRSTKSTNKNRRQILKSVVAGVGAATMAVQNAAAEENSDTKRPTDHEKTKQLRSKYGTAKDVRGLFSENAASLIRDFHDTGVLPEESVDDFNFGRAISNTSEKASIDFLTLEKRDSGKEVARVRLRRETPEYTISVIIEPNNDHAFAHAISENSENKLAVEGEGLVSTQDSCTCNNYCNYSALCGGFCCSIENDEAGYVEYKTMVCDGYFDSSGNCRCDCSSVCPGHPSYKSICSCDSTFGCEGPECSCW